jgi:hypothetical protein
MSDSILNEPYFFAEMMGKLDKKYPAISSEGYPNG